jgi:LmbE family N-acetylglucosaminyl deacetylase
MNVLVIAPHPDDEVIGCGGAIRLRVERGERVSVVFLSSGELGLKHLPRAKTWEIREAEAKKAAKILGVERVHFLRQPDWMLGDHARATAAALTPSLEQERPDVIYLPHENDGHPDHEVTPRILRAALRRCRRLNPELLGYEIWTPLAAHDVTVDISRVMSRKLRALRAHRSQLREFDYVKAITGLNQFRGALAGKCRFAEVFQTLSFER